MEKRNSLDCGCPDTNGVCGEGKGDGEEGGRTAKSNRGIKQ